MHQFVLVTPDIDLLLYGFYELLVSGQKIRVFEHESQNFIDYYIEMPCTPEG